MYYLVVSTKSYFFFVNIHFSCNNTDILIYFLIPNNIPVRIFNKYLN